MNSSRVVCSATKVIIPLLRQICCKLATAKNAMVWGRQVKPFPRFPRAQRGNVFNGASSQVVRAQIVYFHKTRNLGKGWVTLIESEP